MKDTSEIRSYWKKKGPEFPSILSLSLSLSLSRISMKLHLCPEGNRSVVYEYRKDLRKPLDFLSFFLWMSQRSKRMISRRPLIPVVRACVSEWIKGAEQRKKEKEGSRTTKAQTPRPGRGKKSSQKASPTTSREPL
jgi:hypothetical protein